MVIARMTLPTLPRVSAISAIASRIGGIDISPSMKRITMPSAQRTKPETRPMASPTAEAKIATDKPTVSETRAPIEHARIDVAAEHVGAEPESRRRRAGALGGRERGRIDRAEIGREDRDQDQDQQQRAADRDGGMAAQEADEAAPDHDGPQQLRQLRRDGRSPAGSACGLTVVSVNSGSSGRRACR